MEKDELLVRELSELIGVELSYSDDRKARGEAGGWKRFG